MKKIVLILIFLPLFFFSQNKKDSIWKPFTYFIGTWKGEGKMNGKAGKYEITYQFILNKNFIEVKNKSVYPPQNGRKEEVHEDIGYIKL